MLRRQIKVPSKANIEAQKLELNVMPCEIHQTGTVDTAKLFVDSGQSPPLMYFQGHELQGTAVDLPGYIGAVLINPDSSEAENPRREVLFPFAKMNIWHKDGYVKSEDPLGQRLTELLASTKALADI